MRAPFPFVVFAVVTGLGLLTAPADSNAGIIVTPNAEATTEGNTAGNFDASGTGLRVLFDISASQFSALSPGDELTGIAFRTDTNLCGPCDAFAATTLSNVTIELATTSITPTTVDTTFSDYLTTNLQTALSGNVSVSSAGNPIVGGPQAFDIAFNFSTPYLYSPASGNLVLDIIINSTDGLPNGHFVDAEASPSGMSEYFGCVTCANTTTGNGNSNVDIVQFLTAPTAIQGVPEPGTLLLTGSGLVALVASRRNFARRAGRIRRLITS